MVVVDAQNDFVNGVLGTPEAQAVVPNIVEKVKRCGVDNVFWTMDTHYAHTYLFTGEGKKYPIHCLKYSYGWSIVPELAPYVREDNVILKGNFATLEAVESILSKKGGYYDEVEFVGFCTDICVLENVLALHMQSNCKISVDPNCCAGSTPEMHEAAIKILENCLIEVKND